MSREIKVISTSGILGYGFPEESLQRGMERDPHVIGCDGGSTDGGPYYLGSGRGSAGAAVKRDTGLMIKYGLKKNVPVIVGSAGVAGGAPHLAGMVDIIKEISGESKLKFRLGIIHSEQDKQFLKRKLKQGKLTLMDKSEPLLTEQEIDRSARIVGCMGVEPYIKALEKGAGVIVAGRSTDTAIFAALPIKEGLNPGPAWHAGKILECGAISAVPGTGGDCIMATVRDDHFLLEPLNPARRYTTLSAAAHALYENADPYMLHEPGGTLDLTNARYEQVDDRTVRISGSEFMRSEKYYVKLESAYQAGFRSIAIVGVRDPILIGQIDHYLNDLLLKTVHERVRDAFGLQEKDYRINFRVFGRNAIMGDWEPVKETRAHELGILIEVVAPDQAAAGGICALTRTYAVHHDFPGRLTTAGNVAVAFSPADIHLGPAYEFHREHLVELDDADEIDVMFKLELVEL